MVAGIENVESLSVLYVEDDPAHADFTMRSFKRNRIENQITHLTDGQQALDYLFCQGKYSDGACFPSPNLILLDLRLPKVDGLEVLKTIKLDKNLRNIPIVILTTSDADSDIATAYRYNVNSYLVKPLDFNKFTSMVETLGNYWMKLNKYLLVKQ